MTASQASEAKGHLDIEKRETPHDSSIDDDGVGVELRIDRAKEIKLLAKLDFAFIPIIMLVYLSCFLDRSNIGSCAVSFC